MAAGGQPLSGVMIPTSSSNLDTDLTEALRLAGVTEEGVKQEVMKKAGLECSSSSRAKKSLTAGGSILNTDTQ